MKDLKRVVTDASRLIGCDAAYCPNCSAEMLEFERYCPGCGNQNPIYSREAFIKGNNQTPEEHKKNDCDQGHPFMRGLRELHTVAIEAAHDLGSRKETIAQMEDDKPTYCAVCGQRLAKENLHS